MRLICPSCGAMHSLEAFVNDAPARQCLKLIGELPDAVSSRSLYYIALFRSNNRALAWSRALRLLSELKDLIDKYDIMWEGRTPRPNSVMAWAQAMDKIADCPPKSLPLKSHGYLRSIAYQIADEMDRKAEIRHNKAENSGAYAHNRESGAADSVRADIDPTQQVSAPQQERRRRTAEEIAALRNNMKKIGKEM